MVVFSCGHCGDSVPKPKVQRHYLLKCRNLTPNLSCMDCFKDFLGNDYETHVKCISEAERYSGKGFTAKERKGEKKQNAWIEMLQSVLDEAPNASANARRIIETISKQNNTPKKKPKFINFVKNLCGSKTNMKDIDQAWDLISVKLTELSNLNAKNTAQNQKDVASGNNGNHNGAELIKVPESDENDDNNDKLPNNDENEKDAVENVVVKNEVKADCDNSPKKLSKKQRKEAKKKKKCQSELNSVEQTPPEKDTQVKKKNKKNKNKKNEVDNVEHGAQPEDKDKEKKRKRQDTVNAAPEIVANADVQNEKANTIKVQQKKPKVHCEHVSMSLHDQNVAKSKESPNRKEKFNWHTVIISVLKKKDNDVPFKRLQKKVLSEYQEITGNEVDDRIAEKYIKKLRSAPNVKVDKNRVLLVQ